MHDEHYYLLKYLSGKYGVEYKNQVILKKCKNKIYMDGWVDDYAFRTQVRDGQYYYNVKGEFLFEIPESSFSLAMDKNSYIISDRNNGWGSDVYTLNGRPLIKSCDNVRAKFSELSEGEFYLLGFECENEDDVNIFYDHNGDILFYDYDYIGLAAHGACPIYEVRRGDDAIYYNYKGEEIINSKSYYGTYACGVEKLGFNFILCQMTEDRFYYGAEEDEYWISFNGDVIKEEGSTYRNYRVINDIKRENQRQEKLIRERIKNKPKFNHPNETVELTTKKEGSAIDGATIFGSTPIHYDSNPTTNFNTQTEDNSRWINYYNENYNRYVNLLENHLSTLNTLQNTGSGNGTSSYAISQTKSSIKEAQRNMKSIRLEAQQKGIHIATSYLENLSIH